MEAECAGIPPAAPGRNLFRDEGGFTTAGIVVALLVTLALIFTSAQVYQVNAASADIQNVADAAALAAENEVAEFYILSRVCDAVVLSLSLTGIAATGLGIAALCTPVTAPLSEALLKAGADIIKARNRFAEKAAAGLNKIQGALPFLSAANASAVINANSGGRMDAAYIGLAVLLPFEGEEIVVGPTAAAEKLADNAREKKDEIKKEAEEAEEAAKKAREAKERAFSHDCGLNPGYCMYERAGTLAGMPSYENPLYHSIETWDFSVALARAQHYYPYRLSQEAPTDASVEGQADSELRKRFYAYAVRELEQAYVHEDASGSFSANFPLLPKNTSEMKGTALYTEAVYPMTRHDGKKSLHAWPGCPAAARSEGIGTGSLADMDGGGFETCSECRLTPGNFGKIAAASSSIDNGFEYHYRIVAEEAGKYQKAREEYAPHAGKAKDLVNSLLGDAGEAMSEAIAYRIGAMPPGRYGAVALVCNRASAPASKNFESSFVKGSGVLGPQAALSAATLVGDASDEGSSVISSLLDGFSDKARLDGAGIFDAVLDLWSSLLSAYTRGQEALATGVENALDGIPLASESGLGTWAGKALRDFVAAIGLEPVDLDAPKPVLVNSAHVLAADDSAFASRLLGIKASYLSLEGAGSGSLFSAAVSELEAAALESVEEFGEGITIASIELFGDFGPSIPITISLPPAVRGAAGNLVASIADGLRGIESSVTGVRRWE